MPLINDPFHCKSVKVLSCSCHVTGSAHSRLQSQSFLGQKLSGSGDENGFGRLSVRSRACVRSREVAVGMTSQYKTLKSTNLSFTDKTIKKVSNIEHIGMKLIVGVQSSRQRERATKNSLRSFPSFLLAILRPAVY